MTPSLAEQRCQVCTPDTPILSHARAEELLSQVPGWSLTVIKGRAAITRTLKFKGFMPGVDLTNRIAQIAEEEGHHPDLHLSYGQLKVDLTTHAVGGLTDNDFILAAKIDRIQP